MQLTSRAAGRTDGRLVGRSVAVDGAITLPFSRPCQVVAALEERNLVCLLFLSIRPSFSVFFKQTDCRQQQLMRMFLRASARKMRRRTPMNRKRLPPPSSSSRMMLTTKSDLRVVFVLLAAQMTGAVFGEYHGTYMYTSLHGLRVSSDRFRTTFLLAKQLPGDACNADISLNLLSAPHFSNCTFC